ncbi:hypothetical protein T265_14022, partial [Opisthorchis viverrini]
MSTALQQLQQHFNPLEVLNKYTSRIFYQIKRTVRKIIVGITLFALYEPVRFCTICGRTVIGGERFSVAKLLGFLAMSLICDGFSSQQNHTVQNSRVNK